MYVICSSLDDFDHKAPGHPPKRGPLVVLAGQKRMCGILHGAQKGYFCKTHFLGKFRGPISGFAGIRRIWKARILGPEKQVCKTAVFYPRALTSERRKRPFADWLTVFWGFCL